MSQYYSVQTNNRFAFLQEDGEAILGQKPESVIAAEAEKAKNDQSKPVRNNRNNNRDNRNGGRDNNKDGPKRNQPRNNDRAKPDADYEATEDTRGADRQSADVKTENRNRTKFAGKANRSQKQFDRRSGPDARREKGEDTDPAHEQRDRDAADVDAAIDGEASPKYGEDGGERKFNRGPREFRDREQEELPVGVHIDDYFREQEAARFKIEEDEAVEEYNDLQKEIIEGGFKPLARTEAEVHQSLSKKQKKADKEAAKTATELAELGRMSNLHNESRSFGNNRDTRNFRDNKPKKEEEKKNDDIKQKKKAYKDNEIFPGLE